MNSPSLSDPSLAGTKLDRYFHICAFFNSREEEFDVLAPFYKEGLEWGEKNLHIVMADDIPAHVAHLQKKGVDTKHCMACGQLEVLAAQQAYLQNGVFNPEQMLQTVDAVLASGKAAGFPRTRIMGNMGWAFADLPGTEQLIRYEAGVNQVLSRHRQPAVCVYDLAWLSGTMMMDILRCHPLTLVGGVVQENPFYIPPEELLPQLQVRESRRAARH